MINDAPGDPEQPHAQQRDTGNHEAERQQRVARVARLRNRRRCQQCRRVWFEGAAGLATVAIALLTASYAYYSRQQWLTMQQELRAATAATTLARENTATELRAYVSVQAQQGNALRLVTDPKTHQTRVLISFFNAGQTPALNFHDAFATGGVSKSTGEFHDNQITRFRTMGKDQFGGGLLGSAGPNIPAKSAYTEYLPNDQMPNAKEWTEVKEGKRKLTIFGDYEYCDEFGHYHCRLFEFAYKRSPRTGFSPVGLVGMDCPAFPAFPPNEPAPIKVLKRCIQPEEARKAEAYADSNAGKVFPPHWRTQKRAAPAPTK